MNLDRLHRWLLLFALGGWSVVLGGFLAWDLHLARMHMEALAIKEARSNFNKDLAFRLWATRHGGVYVPIDERTPPNPGLAHLPERDITTPSGVELTLMNPAYMLSQIMEEYGDFYGVRGRITSLQPINIHNEPDGWEREALLRFELGVDEVMEFQGRGEDQVLRLMRPMHTQNECLKCHAFQGYQLGDIRGGIGVMVGMKPYLDAFSATRQNRLAFFLVIWLLGIVVIVSLDRQVLRRIRDQERHDEIQGKQTRALERANADLTRLAEVSAHHLMEPTRRLVIYSQRLQERLGEHPDREVLASLDFVQRSAAYLRNLVRDIRLYINAGQPREEVVEQDLEAVIGQVKGNLRELVEEAGAVIELGPDLPALVMDRPRALDIFHALLENSLVHRRPDVAPRITISGRRESGWSSFAVSDNGPGLPAAYRERVVEIFERGVAGPGTGIGLAIVRRIVESRGGELKLTGNEEGGLTVTITLPD